MNRSNEDFPHEPFEALLVAYDQLLEAGQSPPGDSEVGIPQAERRRLSSAQACLRRLEEERLRREVRRGAETPQSGSRPQGDSTFDVPSFDFLPFGKQLGRFALRRELGKGGCGIVYLAFDPLLCREVALKIPRPEVLAKPELRSRFLREGRIAAGFDHRNLVRVYEAGEVGPWCFLVSAYCEGGTLANWLKRQPGGVSIESAAEVVAVLAEAVNYIHQRGVLHRDIKPSNVLLGTRDEGRGARGERGWRHVSNMSGDSGTLQTCRHGSLALAAHSSPIVPLLTDFGLAKLAESQQETKSQDLLGTPLYMAPEQAEGRHADVGPATDVYALGVLLYEMLTGRAPFRGETNIDTLRQIASEEPLEPRRLRPDVPADLQTVCLKCLRKEPHQRYHTAGELADDLRRFLAGEPIRARPLSPWQRGRAWVKRRPAAAGLIAVSALAISGLLGGGLWHAVEMALKNTELERINAELVDTAERESQQRGLAEAREELLRRKLYVSHFKHAYQARQKGEVGQAVEELDGLRSRAGQEDLRGFEWYYLKALCHPVHAIWRGHQGGVDSVAVSADGLTIATGSGDRTVRIWDVPTGQCTSVLRGHRHFVSFVGLSLDGRTLASVSCEDGEIRIWDVATGKERTQFAVGFEPDCAVFTPDGEQLIVGGRGFRFWDTHMGQPATEFLGQPAKSLSMAITPDGRTVITGNDDKTVRLWDVASRRERLVLPGHRHFVWRTAVSPDGRTLASGSWDKTVKLWDVATGELKATLEGHKYELSSVAFSPDGRILASAAFPGQPLQSVAVGEVKLWDVGTSRPLPCDFDRIAGKVQALAFVPSSRLLALGCADKTIKLLDTGPALKRRILPGHGPKETWSVVFSPDSRTLASAGDDHLIKLWDPQTGRLWTTLEGHEALVTAITYSPDGRTLASASFDKTLKLWDASTGQLRKTLTGAENRLRCVAFSPDGRILAAGEQKKKHSSEPSVSIRLWEVAAGQELMPLACYGPVHALAFSPDGKVLASASKDGKVRLWNTTTWQLSRFIDDTDEVSCVAFAADGKTLACGNDAGIIRLWDSTTGQESAALRGHVGKIHGIAFSPDGLTVASAGADTTVRLWQAATGEELIILNGHATRVNAVAFAPDGSLLASAGHDGSLNLWCAAER
jgi:WD40 repeat protein/serine/threonine protein kinase